MRVRVKGRAFNRTENDGVGGRGLVMHERGEELDVSVDVYRKHADVLEPLDFGDELALSIERAGGQPVGQPDGELDDLPPLDELLANVDDSDPRATPEPASNAGAKKKAGKRAAIVQE